MNQDELENNQPTIDADTEINDSTFASSATEQENTLTDLEPNAEEIKGGQKNEQNLMVVFTRSG